MTRGRLGKLLPFASVLLVAVGVSSHAQVARNCSLPMNRFLPECVQRGSGGSSGSGPSAQQTIDAINRNTAEQQRRLNESFDRLRDVVKQYNTPTSSGDSKCGLGGGGIPIGAGLDCLNREYEDAQRNGGYSEPAESSQRGSDSWSRPFERDAGETARQRDEQRRIREADDLLREAQRMSQSPPSQQDCIAAMSTYRAGPQREMPPGCLSDIERMSVYRSGSMPAATQPVGWSADAILDGSNIPSTVVFPDPSTNAIERVFTGPPAPIPASPTTPSTPSDLEHAPNTPSTTLTPYYDSSTSPLTPGWSRPGAGRPLSPWVSDEGIDPSTLEILPTHPPEPTWFDNMFDWLRDRGLAPPRPGPMRIPGAPDDTLKNHQADMDRATNGWRILNPLKYPLEVQRTVNDKMDRAQEYPHLKDD